MPPSSQAAKEYLAYGLHNHSRYLHLDCWDKYMEANHDIQSEKHAVGFLADMIYNTKKGEHFLKGRSCAQCNKPFKSTP